MKKTDKTVLGWREWVAFPALGIEHIKAKVDTGARTSALHAFYVKRFTTGAGQDRVEFKIHPLQNNSDYAVKCVADVIDERSVKDSGGHSEQRLVIRTPVVIGDCTHDIELTLTDRETMKFRMLLGRTALRGAYLVDADRSYILGKPEQ